LFCFFLAPYALSCLISSVHFFGAARPAFLAVARQRGAIRHVFAHFKPEVRHLTRRGTFMMIIHSL
jgi:hypothetical protein